MFAALYKLSTPQSPKAIDRMLGIISRGSSPDARYAKSHPAQTRASLAALADGCRQGPQGPADDIRRLCLPWGFELPEVIRPVQWWHGKQDANVSLAAGQAVTDRLPNVTTHFVAGGHYTLFEHADEVMAALRRVLRHDPDTAMS
jgi:pimeloyl-ACP methyl ester carboxylesterase